MVFKPNLLRLIMKVYNLKILKFRLLLHMMVCSRLGLTQWRRNKNP